MIDKATQDKIINYLWRKGRPIDVSRLRYRIGETGSKLVLQFLNAYQNPDGGYGRGLEPDNMSPHSSPISSWAAIRILRKLIDNPVTETQVKRLFQYLDKTPDFVNGRWRGAVPSTNDYPHAPWWTFDEATEAETWGYNPTAELAGFILRFESPYSPLYARAEGIIRKMIPVIMAPEYGLTGHELGNVTTMYKDILIAGRLDLVPDYFEEFLQDRVKEALTDSVAKFGTDEYYLSPTHYIMGTDSPYYAANKEAAEAYADHLEASVTEDGYWEPNWTWGDQPIPADALRDWRSDLTLENFLYLKGLGRM